MDKAKRSIYKAFCEKAKLPIFVQDWFLDSACKDGVWGFVSEEKKGEVIGVWPYFIKKKYGFSYLAMPPFVRYLGPFLLPEYNNLKDQHRIYESLEKRLPVVHSFNQNFDPSVTNWLPFYWKKYRQSTRYTYRLNIENLGPVFKSFGRDIQRNITKAKEQIEVVEDGTPEQFYEVHKMTFDRQEMGVPYPLEFFLDHFRALKENGNCKLFFAKDGEGQIHAVGCLMKDRDMAYYHISGANPELRKSGAGILLAWYLIQYSKEQWGVNIFDFEGSMIKNVEQVWHRMGGNQVPYFNIQKSNSRLFAFLERLKGRR
jgi:lipid II:glycine glycyltransferase (peptidoglycan interpeptide bridge formation enzyme)